MYFKRFTLKTRRICQIKSPTELYNIDIAVLFITCEAVSCLRFVSLCEHPFSFRIPLQNIETYHRLWHSADQTNV